MYEMTERFRFGKLRLEKRVYTCISPKTEYIRLKKSLFVDITFRVLELSAFSAYSFFNLPILVPVCSVWLGA